MASPAGDSYSCFSGGVISAGRHRMPLWARSAPLMQWTEIAGTIPPSSCDIDGGWAGYAVKQATSELIVVASGGHLASYDNGAYSCALNADVPAWVTRKYTSASPASNVLYYPDGTPTSRHLYHYIHYIESIDAVVLAGCRFGYGGDTPTGPGMDLFSLASNEYLPRYTYPDIPAGGDYGLVKDGQGRVWTQTGRRFDPANESWTTTGATLDRFPAAYDSTRNVLFSMQWGDGQGYDSGTTTHKVDVATATTSAITINASAAYTAWQAAAPAYAAMDYDAPNDCYLFYHGGETGKVYSITPNSGTAWDMSVLPTTGTPATAPSNGSGINKRFQYFDRLGGFVLLPNAGANLWFLRTRQ